MMYGLKCLMDAAMLRASISHGSKVTWCFRNLALKKPASCTLLSLFTYNVAPIPLLATEPLVTIQSWSDVRGSVIKIIRQFLPRFSPVNNL